MNRKWIWVWRIVGFFFLWSSPGKATPFEGGSIWVVNAMLVDRHEEHNAQPISLQIKQGQLKMILVGTPPFQDIDWVIDAKQGYVLGQLEVGSPANFIILDQNPMEQFDALLDTQTHAVFVLKEGQIIRNRLLPAPAKEEEPAPPKSGWFAYSAPPFLLPLEYQRREAWNHYRGKYVHANFIAGLLLDRMVRLGQDEKSKGQVGEISPFDGGEVRALRFGAVGTFNFEKPWVYTFFLATRAFDQGFDSAGNADDVTVFDLRLDIPLFKDTSLSVGKQKEPISMERLMTLVDLPLQERSAVSDAMMPSRNIGVVLSGTGFDRRSSWAGGLFNPWIDEDNTIAESSTQLIGRGTVVPLMNTAESSLLHLGVGVRYSNTRKAVQYRSSPEFNQAPLFVNTGPLIADYSMLYDLEAAWRWGSFLLNGEYVINQVDTPAAGLLSFNGFHLTASYVLTGEMRAYNKRSGIFSSFPVAKPVTEGGWGAWEVATRFSTVDLQERGVAGGAMDIYSLGLNWKLTALASLSMNYRHIVLEQSGERGAFDGLLMRVTLILE